MGIRGPAREAPAILCEYCGEEIESCEGLHGDWFHTATRREACALPFPDDDLYAFPQFPERLKG